MTSLPGHIGIIMDGNGRWAKERGMPRSNGHKEGLEAAKRVIRFAADTGIPFVTLYTFSTENWKRAEEEVGFLMSLLKTHLRSELAFYRENGIRVMHIGDKSGLPAEIIHEIDETTRETSHFSRTTTVLAINYGGQNEIIRAIKKIPQEKIIDLTEQSFSTYLDYPDLPPVDFLIRTGGEKRISNFLLWQSAYAELFFSDILWPDWTGEHLSEAIREYQSRERRFGNAK